MYWRIVLTELMTPLIRRAPLGKHTLFSWCIGSEAGNWDRLKRWPRPIRTFFDRSIGARVKVDSADWVGRRHYVCGEHYDRVHRLVIQRLLRAGDVYVDVGANHGVFTLAASRVVGPAGRVISVEPNPAAFEWLRSVVSLNHLDDRCDLHNVGLSDTAGELVLRGSSDHDGILTFRPAAFGDIARRVPVRRGEDLLGDLPHDGRVMIKIDTEGHEHRVIQGLGRAIDLPGAMLYVEVTDQWLRDSGSSAHALFEDLRARGAELP